MLVFHFNFPALTIIWKCCIVVTNNDGFHTKLADSYSRRADATDDLAQAVEVFDYFYLQ